MSTPSEQSERSAPTTQSETEAPPAKPPGGVTKGVVIGLVLFALMLIAGMYK
jgi:hypothetical protein